MQTRLDRFRAYMAELDAAANPRHAFERNLYVPPPFRSLADELATRLQLNPTSSHLVVGGVGSGKTTQLLVTQQIISKFPDMAAPYLDVSTYHDLARMEEGVLVVLAGLTLAGMTKADSAEANKAAHSFNGWAHGYVEWVEDEEPDWGDNDGGDYEPSPGRLVKHKGLIAPPLLPLSASLHEKTAALKVLRNAIPPERQHIALVFDSMDRVPNVDTFRAAVQNDVRALKMAGIACVIVGPSRVFYGPSRSIVDIFDESYWQPTIDVRHPAMQHFVTTVLRRRAKGDVLPDDACALIVKFSGGVMRDLITIGRRAGEEAYVAGSDVVRLDDVARAADAFGRSLMLGLGTRELQVLQGLRTTGAFVPTSDQDLALLETRRVLDYGGDGAHRYVVHPTIEPLLAMVS